MERLWAPWRMAYIGQGEVDGCIFCDKPALEDSEAMIVYRSQLGFIMLNAYPYNNGHLLVSPYKHTAEMTDLNSEERLELMNLVEMGISGLKKACSPDGFNVGVNLGRVAGAGVAGHLHFHIVPRWNGDTNFMPVLSDIKVLPEALESVWASVKEALSGEAGTH